MEKKNISSLCTAFSKSTLYNRNLNILDSGPSMQSSAIFLNETGVYIFVIQVHFQHIIVVAGHVCWDGTN